MYQFTQDCITGIEIIDGEHCRLFAMINNGMELINSDDKIVLEVAKDLVSQLKGYAAQHFAHEEAYMEKIGDKELERQKKEHAKFTEYMNSHDETTFNEENAKEKVEELLVYLSKWLYGHIIASDLMIGHVTIDINEEDPFAFTDKYKTGIEIIDNEHKKLFEIIKRTNDLLNDEFTPDKYDDIMDIIEELKDYTVKHFSDEEAYMEEIGYPGLEAQVAAHTAFVYKLGEVDYGRVDEDQHEYLLDLVEYLLNWLSTHILRMDKKIPIKKI